MLSLDDFAPVFEPLQGRHVGFLRMYGNAGDRLADAATYQMLDAYGIEHLDLTWRDTAADMAETDDHLVDEVDEIVVAGGGSLGNLYPRCQLLRRHYLELGKPVTILPQSITGDGEDLSRYKKVFLRERASLAMHPAGSLAPDVALGLTPPFAPGKPDLPLGVFLRAGKEALFAGSALSLADPAQCCVSYQEYLRLAGRFERLITDRLHFAIAAMLMGARVELLPVGYHKNRAMHETWLADLGCGWREDLTRISYDKEAVERELADGLSYKASLGRAL